MNKKLEQISELLPEGLSEATVNEVADLVDTAITDQVKSQVDSLSTQVVSFIRANVDKFKDQALKELEYENSTYRNAQLFEAVKNIMSTELTVEDEDNAIAVMSTNQLQLEKEMDVAVKELNKVLEENTKLANVVKVLNDKVRLLESKNKSLQDKNKNLGKSVEDLKEANDQPFESSERAFVVSHNGKGDSQDNDEYNENDLLTEEIMKFMPNRADREKP